jgi:hypothetical protein
MTETCEPCDAYLVERRRQLLPHIGRWVCRTRREPAEVVGRLAHAFHERGHER